MFFLHEVEVKLRSPADQVEVKLRGRSETEIRSAKPAAIVPEMLNL